MIGFLIFCVLTQNVVSNNISSKELEEAYKYFESIHTKANAVTSKNIFYVPATQKPNDINAALHNLRQPVIPNKIPVEVPKFLQSKEADSNHGDFHKIPNDEGSNRGEASRTPIEQSEVADDTSKFEDVLENLFDNKPDENNKASIRQYLRTQAEERRMLEWIKKLIGRTSTAATTEPVDIGVLPIQNKDENSLALINQVLTKLNNALEKLNHLVEEHLRTSKKDAFFVLKIPVTPKSNTSEVRFRRKREIKANEMVANDTRTNNRSKAIDYSKVTIDNTKNDKDDSKNSFKYKILAHLKDSFNEIKYKMAPLTKVKEDHSSNDLYKIGYIAANVDTLEENLNKFMKELEKNKDKWDEKKVLEFLDKLKTSNRVLRTLMKYLEKLTEKKTIYARLEK